MTDIRPVVTAIAMAGLAAAQEHVNFPTRDGGVIYADLYGKGERAVVLAHGAKFNKESWARQAKTLAESGYRVLAIDFRGYGQSHGPGQGDLFTGPLYLDVLAAAHYLREAGAKSVALVGASMGGMAAAKAFAEAEPGEVDRLVVLAAVPKVPPERLRGPKLFLVARDDAIVGGLHPVKSYYEKTPEPKELIVLDGASHAQALFDTSQGERVMQEILRFLAAS